MDELRQDLRSALRLITRSPAFAAVVIVTLAVAIGATTSVFSVVRGLLLRPLPFREPAQLVRIQASYGQLGAGTISLSELRDDLPGVHSLSAVGGWAFGSGSLDGPGGREHIGLGRATPSLLNVLGVQPLLGRWFTPDEEEPGRARVVVLGRALWQRRFGADPAVVGRTIEITGKPFRVVGVVDDLDLPEHFDAWRPLPYEPRGDPVGVRATHFLRVVGRANNLAALQAQLAVTSARLSAQYPRIYPADSHFQFLATPLLDQMVGPVRGTLWMLFGAVALVLLMACANVGNLMLAKASARERELAVRAALGAGRARLVRQLLVESVLLALAGGALGVMLALWGVDLLLAFGPRNLPRAASVRVDTAVLLFAVGASLASGVLFGLLPAITATQAKSAQVLRSGTASAARNPRRLRRALVVADLALALVLVSGAALLLRSFTRVLAVEPGFDPSGATTFIVGLPRDDVQTFRAALQRLRELPGSSAAGATDYAPLSGVANDASFHLEGKPVPAGVMPPDEELRIATPQWFEAMGIARRQGRFFEEEEKAPVLVVNESFARKYGGPGLRLQMDGDDRWWTVVGVSADVREFGLDAPVRPTMYAPLQFVPQNTLTLVVRSQAAPAQVLREAQKIFAGLDPLATAYAPVPLREMLAASVAQRAFAMALLHGFAFLALLLAGLGLYGVLAYNVLQRTREIGVRMALGARPSQAIALVARESAVVTGIGLLLGGAGALVAGRSIAGLLFGVAPADPLSLLAAVIALGLVALLATLWPARRAAHVDPAIALRAE